MPEFIEKAEELIRNSEKEELLQLLKEGSQKLPADLPLLELLKITRRAEIKFGNRKPTLGIYDHAFHFVGGAQKYGLTIVESLKEIFDITIISSKPVSIEQFSSWYSLDLTGCKIEVIPIPFYDQSYHIDPRIVTHNTGNHFHVISRESANYDLFINNSMLEKIFPMSAVSLMICHFPERFPINYFYSQYYTETIYNSMYTKQWIEVRWQYTPHQLVYPPADMELPKRDKKKLIISVARFEEGGTKKQLEMLNVFLQLNREFPSIKEWTLVMAGGTREDNPYFQKLKKLAEDSGLKNIILKPNIPEKELRVLYSEASIFWHLCGLGQNDPAKVEHFGMTIAEAMQNRVAPIVFDGGGQKEIVSEGENGFRASTSFELGQHTLKLIKDPELLEKIGEAAYQKSIGFSKNRFKKQFREIGENIISKLVG